MKNYNYKSVLKYTAAGILFGCMLVINAYLLNRLNGFNGPWFHIFDYSPDFIIIILSPIILGLLFCFIGIRWQQLVAFNRQIKDNLSHEQMMSSMADQQVKLLGKVMAQINEAVMIADNAGCILWINEGFTKITGYQLGEVIGRKPDNFLLGPLSNKASVNNIKLTLFKGEAIVEEMVHYRKDGSVYWAMVSVKPIYNDAGEITHHIAIESDITSRKEKELAIENEIAERKELEKKLVANKNKLELAMEIAQFGAWEVDVINKTLYLSKELREIYHLPLNDDISMDDLFKYIHPGDTSQVWESIALAAKGEKDEFEYRFIVEGETRYMVSNITPRIDEQGNLTGYFGTVKDITKRKLTELALKKSEEEKAAVLNNAQTVICRHDFNGVILDINIAAEKLSGYTREELIGSNLKAMVSPDYHEYFDTYLSEIITKQVANGSLQIISKTGKKMAWLYQNIVYDNKTDNPYIIASAIDITESVKAQNEIERQQQFIHQIIDNSPNMVFVMNEQQQIILSNKTFCKYYQYNSQEIPYAADLSKGSDDIFLGDIDSILELQEGEILRLEGSIADNDNNSINWFNIIKKCFKEKSGKKYFLGFGMDITGRYQVETDLIAANEMVERSLRVKDQFISNMSHEIRTPLNAVIGFTDLLADTSLNKEQCEYVEIVKSASQNLLALINNILDLSKIESGNLALETQPMDIRQIATDAVKFLEPKAKSKGIKIKANVASNVSAKVIGDQLRLSQILFNLLGNAVKFTDVGYVELNCKMVSGPDDQMQYISFSVRDTGIGVPAEKQDVIFDRFTQATSDTERLYGGTGLGLNIAKSIVDMHGSKLTMESVPGKGTMFQFILSFKKIEDTLTVEDDNLSSENNTLSSSASPVKVLLAEDNLINAMLAKKVLENREFTVTHVTNGALALEAVQQQHFDVVLMDIQMPVMDGITATKSIRKLPGAVAKIPIVAMTAHSLSGEMQNCYNAGVTGYVSKPFKPANLFAAIMEAINMQHNSKKVNNVDDTVTHT